MIIIDGHKGSGFSCKADREVLARLPELLEYVAQQIRQDGPFTA